MMTIFCRACNVEFRADAPMCPSCMQSVPPILMSDSLHARMQALATTPTTYVVAPTRQPQRTESQMSDDELADMEWDHRDRCPYECFGSGATGTRCRAVDLFVEVRRLRREIRRLQNGSGEPISRIDPAIWRGDIKPRSWSGGPADG